MPGDARRLNAERQAVRRDLGRRPPPVAPPPDPSRPIGEETLTEIRHVVVLMMENHSYDNYLGTLDRGDGFPRGLDGRPSATNPDGSGRPVAARPRGNGTQEHELPTQSWHASHVQSDAGKNDGFVRSSEALLTELDPPLPDPTVAMQYWTERELPFYHGLANTFPLMDRWFSSCLGPTFPNRRFLIAGTAHGLIDDLPTGLFDYPEAGTIFDLLTAYGIDWANYHHVTPLLSARNTLARLLGKPGLLTIRALGLFAAQIPGLKALLAGRGAFGDYLMRRIQFTANLYPLGWRGARNHLRSLEDFFRDAEDGTLPPFSIVDPDFKEFSEENPQDVTQGEAFAGSVIKAVTHGKGWPHTLLIWTYDEHGGYYDHVPAPPAVSPDDVLGHSLLNVVGKLDWLLRRFRLWRRLKEADDSRIGTRLEPRTYDRLGFRVPTVIVSPFAKKDYVSSRDGPRDGDAPRVYDHTSILKTIERKWNLPPLTRRDAEAHDVLDALDLEVAAFLTPPALPEPRAWAG
jgi:phospholipase C